MDYKKLSKTERKYRNKIMNKCHFDKISQREIDTYVKKNCITYKDCYANRNYLAW